MMKFIIFMALTYICLGASQSAEEILRKVDENMYADAVEMISTMKIYGERAERTLKAKTYSMGREKSLTEFLDPPRENGVKMLKIDDDLWTFYPKADRIVKISGHMLRQSLMGSDLSYEDMMEDEKLYESYDAEILGSEPIDGRACHVMQLVAKRENQTYQLRKLWVDKEHFLPLQEELYAKGGKLLKRINIKDIRKVNERWYPFSILYKDMLTAGRGTELVIHSVIFDPKLSPQIFSKGVLRR